MEPNPIRAQLLSLLTTVAPDIEPESVDPERDLRDQFDFDSMDALHFATAVSKAFGFEIAATDYPRLAPAGDWAWDGSAPRSTVVTHTARRLALNREVPIMDVDTWLSGSTCSVNTIIWRTAPAAAGQWRGARADESSSRSWPDGMEILALNR